MLCKYCKQNTIVVDGVDNRDSDETYRLRVCPKCGRIFYTVEFPVEADRRFTKDWINHHKKHKKIIKNTYFTPEGIKRLLNKVYGRKRNKKNKEEK